MRAFRRSCSARNAATASSSVSYRPTWYRSPHEVPRAFHFDDDSSYVTPVSSRSHVSASWCSASQRRVSEWLLWLWLWLWLWLRLWLQLSRAVRLAAARGVLRRPLLALAPLRPRPSWHWLSGSSAPPSSVAPPHPHRRPFAPERARGRACRQRPFAAETHAMGGPEHALSWAATLHLRPAVATTWSAF